MWRRIKMFNTKLIITNAMRQLRIDVLVSMCPVWGVPSFSTLFPVLAMRCSGTTLFTRCSCAATTGFNLIPVILAAGTLSLLSFQGVRPVTCSISPRMTRESCALKVGSVSGFPTVLVWGVLLYRFLLCLRFPFCLLLFLALIILVTWWLVICVL